MIPTHISVSKIKKAPYLAIAFPAFLAGASTAGIGSSFFEIWKEMHRVPSKSNPIVDINPAIGWAFLAFFFWLLLHSVTWLAWHSIRKNGGMMSLGGGAWTLLLGAFYLIGIASVICIIFSD